jgi:hypothetical protein
MQERDADIERVLTGRPVDDPALARVADALTSMVELGRIDPTPERVARVAGAAARAAADSPSDSPAFPSPKGQRRLRRLNPGFVVPLALVLVFTMFGGAALAAQDSVPGDPLYGLNLALERIGIGQGGVEKRLGEAARLAERGRAGEALLHAARSIAGTADDEAEEAAHVLSDLAATVDETEGSGAALQAVAEMLRWMAENSGLLADPEAAPGAFGQGVAEMARRITEERGRPDQAGPPADSPGSSSQGPPQGEPPNRP